MARLHSRLAQRLRKSGRSVAAARSTTDCGISTSANRGDYRGSQPAGLRYHYKIVMFSQDNFWGDRPTKVSARSACRQNRFYR